MEPFHDKYWRIVPSDHETQLISSSWALCVLSIFIIFLQNFTCSVHLYFIFVYRQTDIITMLQLNTFSRYGKTLFLLSPCWLMNLRCVHRSPGMASAKNEAAETEKFSNRWCQDSNWCPLAWGPTGYLWVIAPLKLQTYYFERKILTSK